MPCNTFLPLFFAWVWLALETNVNDSGGANAWYEFAARCSAKARPYHYKGDNRTNGRCIELYCELQYAHDHLNRLFDFVGSGITW